MSYDAITIDTNIFDKNALQLESGLLGQLTQFKEGSAEFVLSEIVLRELRRHLIKKALENRAALLGSLKRVIENGLLSPKDAEAAGAVLSNLSEVESAVDQRLESFVRGTGATIIPATNVSLPEILERYFNTTPPFGKGKKSEFPDAIALASLSSWAKKNKKRLCAVSEDPDWLAFAKERDEIGVEVDFVSALGLFQSRAKEAPAIVAKLLPMLVKHQPADMFDALERGISDALSDVSAYAEATSAFHYDADMVELTYRGFAFKNPDNPKFDLVRVGADVIVANIEITVTALATCVFDLSVHDSIDGDYVRMGDVEETIDTEFEASMIVTLVGDFAVPEELEVDKVELTTKQITVDFGYVEPDWSD